MNTSYIHVVGCFACDCRIFAATQMFPAGLAGSVEIWPPAREVSLKSVQAIALFVSAKQKTRKSTVTEDGFSDAV
jgi:hypothetical protein